MQVLRVQQLGGVPYQRLNSNLYKPHTQQKYYTYIRASIRSVGKSARGAGQRFLPMLLEAYRRCQSRNTHRLSSTLMKTVHRNAHRIGPTADPPTGNDLRHESTAVLRGAQFTLSRGC